MLEFNINSTAVGLHVFKLASTIKLKEKENKNQNLLTYECKKLTHNGHIENVLFYEEVSYHTRQYGE